MPKVNNAETASQANELVGEQLRMLARTLRPEDGSTHAMLVIIGVLSAMMTIQAEMADACVRIADRLDKEGKFV